MDSDSRGNNIQQVTLQQQQSQLPPVDFASRRAEYEIQQHQSANPTVFSKSNNRSRSNRIFDEARNTFEQSRSLHRNRDIIQAQ